MLTVLAASAITQVLLERQVDRDRRAHAYVGNIKSVQSAPVTVAYPQLEIGDSGAVFRFAEPPGQPIFRMIDDSGLRVSRVDGRVNVTMLIRDADGSAVAPAVSIAPMFRCPSEMNLGELVDRG